MPWYKAQSYECWLTSFATYLKAETVHLEKHLTGEEDHEEQVRDLLEVVEPRGLAVMLRSEDAGVEEHKDDDEPEHGLGLDCSPAAASRPPVKLLEGLFLLLEPGIGLGYHPVVPAFVLGITCKLRCNSN